MFRYVVLSWDVFNPDQSRAAQLLSQRLLEHSAEWKSVLDRNGLKVLHAGGRQGVGGIYRFPDQTGILLGVVFGRKDADEAECSPIETLLKRQEAVDILATRGRRLIERYWGSYVAFLLTDPTGEKLVLRDPGGVLPCFRTAFHGVHVFFSCLEDLTRLGHFGFSINWDYIRLYASRTSVRSQETALSEVTEIQPGECVEIRGPYSSSRMYWDPLRIAMSDVIECPETASRLLRKTAKKCLHAWASLYDGIVLRLSGGLDSSIVLGCLHDAPRQPTITCLSYFSDSYNDDERIFARLAAKRAGCELIERERNACFDLREMLNVPASPKPYFYLGSVERTRPEAELARDRRATAIFGGEGGDELFCRSGTLWSVTDRLYAHGPDAALIGVALDVASFARTSVWRVLGGALQDRLLNRGREPWRGTSLDRQLVNSEAFQKLEEDERFIQPSLRHAGNIPPGKLLHAYQLLCPHLLYDPFAQIGDPQYVQPLLSQPLVEACLRMPTYLLTAGGQDRVIARRAFAADLPTEIRCRRQKGGPDKHHIRILSRNIAFARELLLDGMMAREGVLRRAELENALADESFRTTGVFAEEVLDHLCTEAWLAGWRQNAANAVSRTNSPKTTSVSISAAT